jgi:hypothetical protein
LKLGQSENQIWTKGSELGHHLRPPTEAALLR